MSAALTRISLLEAMRAAGALRSDIGAEDEENLDVFAVIRRLGMIVAFQPLDNLLGAIIREGSGGVLISTSRDVSVQRYTAAHEIGHWALHGGRTIWDSAESVTGSPRSQQEREAQAFAGAFLMPTRLLHRALRRHGVLPSGPVSPESAYLVSRDLGVSYQALVEQMAAVRILSPAQRNALGQVRPLKLKTAILGETPLHTRAHVWDMRTATHEQVRVAIGDELLLPHNSYFLPAKDSGTGVSQRTLSRGLSFIAESPGDGSLVRPDGHTLPVTIKPSPAQDNSRILATGA